MIWNQKSQVHGPYICLILRVMFVFLSGSTYPQVCQKYFEQIWRHSTSELKVRKHHRFALCDECVANSTKAAQSNMSLEERLLVKKNQARHLEMVSFNIFCCIWVIMLNKSKVDQERCKYFFNIFRSIHYPQAYLSLIIDGADQVSVK